MRESGFWKKLRESLKLDMMERVENKIAAGWPDVFILHNEKTTWIELKIEKKFPARINFEPAQPNWLCDYSKIGGRCFVFLFVEDENLIYVWKGSDSRQLNKDARSVLPFFRLIADDEGFEYLYVKLFL